MGYKFPEGTRVYFYQRDIESAEFKRKLFNSCLKVPSTAVSFAAVQVTRFQRKGPRDVMQNLPLRFENFSL